MPTTETQRPASWPSVDEVRKKIDRRLKADGLTRASMCRRYDLAATTLEKAIKLGLSLDARPSVVEKFRRAGIIDLIPRR